VNEESFLIHCLVSLLLLLFGYEEYWSFWWDYNIPSPPNSWNGEEGLFSHLTFSMLILVNDSWSSCV